MMFVIVVGIIFSMITMIATSKGAEEVKTNEGYKEYRLPDDPNWLAMAILRENSWKNIKSCLSVPEHNVCTDLKERQINSTSTELDQNELTPTQVFLSLIALQIFLSFLVILHFDFVDGRSLSELMANLQQRYCSQDIYVRF